MRARDPLAEFSEKLAESLLDAKRVERRKQKGYDLTRPSGEEIEVKYVAQLAKEDGGINWKNWHTIKFNEYRDKYALVVFVDLLPVHMFVFGKHKLQDLCLELGKRHPQQDRTLQFTKTNYYAIINNQDKFKNLGVDVFTLT
jgi:hypothetical protein